MDNEFYFLLIEQNGNHKHKIYLLRDDDMEKMDQAGKRIEIYLRQKRSSEKSRQS